MDVTCERCSTEYEFDDALVSEKGTTVKCTTCGHQFKVRRTDGVKPPELWLVRTLDGRELEFRALRELQAAIGSHKVTRDDVLSRGSSRPRRLGSIAELEPFFGNAAKAIVATHFADRPAAHGSRADAARARSLTPAGLGPVSSDALSGSVADSAHAVPTRTEGSIAIPLPIAVARDPNAPPIAARALGTSDAAGEASAPAGRGSDRGLDPDTDAEGFEAPSPDIPSGPRSEDNTLPFVRRYPLYDDDEDTESGAPTSARARGPSSSRPVSSGAGREAIPPDRVDIDSAPTEVRAARGTKPSTTQRMAASEPSDGSARSGLPPVAEKAKERPSGEAERATDAPDAVGRRRVGSAPPLTPTPSAVRVSYMESGEESLSEPRFSSAALSGRTSSGTRLIVGLVLGGAILFGLVLVGRRYVTPTAPTAPTAAVSDERITALVEGGARSLTEGDLVAAKEQLDKASALAEDDPRVAIALAQLEVIRADVPWLRLRLLDNDSPDRDAAKRELARAIARAEKAAERASKLASDRPEVTRVMVDVRRLGANRDEARKLVPKLTGGAGNDDNAFVLGALDLSEEKPPWPTVIDRLQKAAEAENNLGRAQALLVYALARSGDVARARTELARLGALPVAHPLLSEFRSFLDRAEKGDVAPVDVDSLPDVSDDDVDEAVEASSEPASGGSFSELLQRAQEARASGDLGRAEDLFVEALSKHPGNSEAQAGLADVARARGQTAKAIALYEKVLHANPGYLPALASLADLKWDSGDKGTARSLYRQVLDRSPSGPFADRARERLDENKAAAPDSPPPSSPPPSSPPPASPPPASPPPDGPPPDGPPPTGPVGDDYVHPGQGAPDVSDLGGSP